MSNPYQTPQFAQTEIAAAAVIDREKLRRIAKYQQWVLYALLAMIVTYFAAILARAAGFEAIGLLIAACLLPIGLASMVAAFLLTNELSNPFVAIVCAVLMLIPCVALLTLFLINGRATKHLQTHGIKVGFMGANPNTI